MGATEVMATLDSPPVSRYGRRRVVKSPPATDTAISLIDSIVALCARKALQVVGLILLQICLILFLPCHTALEDTGWAGSTLALVTYPIHLLLNYNGTVLSFEFVNSLP